MAGTGSPGPLARIRTGESPARCMAGNHWRSGSGSPCCFDHVSRKSFWSCPTAGPSIRTLVSRQPTEPAPREAPDPGADPPDIREPEPEDAEPVKGRERAEDPVT